MPRIAPFALATLRRLAIAVCAAAAAEAQDAGTPRPVCGSPCPPDARCLVRPCPQPVPATQRTSTHVRAVLDGRIVRYEIEDRYVNRSGVPAEVDYLLPLPKGAAFENLELSINGEMVAGETMRAERARGVYEEIVRKLRDPALVEWMGHDLLRTRIFPVQPGEEKRVLVRFSAVVQREGDALRLDWPARAMAGARTDDDWFELRYAAQGAGETLGDAYSPTHTLATHGRDEDARTVRAADAARTMTVLIPVRRAHAATIGFLPYAPSGEDGYALITVAPPARRAEPTPRDLTFIVDVSGSMAGRKIEQARAAGRQFLASLDRRDRFRLIAFSSDVQEFRDGWAPVTDATIREATTFVNDLRASGGTNIAGALDAALAATPRDGRLPLVLLLTDGAPTVGETRPESIATRAAQKRRQARVFTFGIGADVNAQLLEQLALQGRGTATFLRPDESVERAVGVVAERLTAPVATDVTVTLDGARLYAMQPNGPVDLFAGQDLVLLARYRGDDAATTLTISGRGPNGPVTWTQRVQLPRRSTANAFVARLWAVQRAGWLSAERRRTGGNRELDDELRTLGERYGIPTELTSYLVVEPNAQVADPRRLSTVNRPAPGATAPLSPLTTTAAGAATNDVQRFEAAKRAAEQRDLKSLGDERKEKEDGLRVAGARTFRRDASGAWADTRPRTATRTVTVRAYSEAYFALLRELPALAEWFAVGDNVRVEGRAVTLVLATDAGDATLDAATLAAIVRDWQ